MSGRHRKKPPRRTWWWKVRRIALVWGPVAVAVYWTGRLAVELPQWW
ncbi:hypothetical protein [Streptomyces sp. NBC_01257]|nr:hypothetical protein [Streptomyces sp. NBC_01257]WRZ67354.1 hypothetical protein OG408_27280 [Streptomyces sp. NBC_01257]